MPQEHNTVFINYRRETSAFIARAIFNDLRHYGYDVFMDVESIDSGTFDTIILNQIKARAHFLVILSPGSLDRCDNPNDWVRREIEFAIEHGRNVVPLMTGGFRFADYEALLTGTLGELQRFNGIDVPHTYFDAAMERLRTRFLKKPVRGVIETAPPSDEQEVQRKVEKTADQPVPTEEEMTAEEHFSSGYTKQEEGDLDGAIHDYDEAIRLNPQYVAAYGNRGIVRQAQGDRAGAIADYDEVIRLNSQDALAYYNRGIAHYGQGDMESAIADYTEAIRLNPQYAMAYGNRGIVRKAQGDLAGAIADYDEVIWLDPQDALAYINRGIARKAQGDIAGAIADYQRYLDLGGGKQHGNQAQVEEWIADLKRQLASQ